MTDSVNEVRLVGRVAGVQERLLPSGDTIVTFRVVTDRAAHQRGPSGKVSVDTHDCVVHTAALRRKVMRLNDGDWISAGGALRRRFWSGPGGPVSRSEIEVGTLTRC